MGHSQAGDAVSAVAELHAQLGGGDLALVVFFCSARFDLDVLTAEINRRFAGVPVVGCTTAGEIGPLGYGEHGLSGVSFAKSGFVAECGRLDALQSFEIEQGRDFAVDLMLRIRDRTEGRKGCNYFGLLLIDGLSMREEPVTMAIQDGLGGIHVVGGSAGDDQRFERTWVFHEGRFHTDSAVLTLLATELPFRPLRTQHFVPDIERLVVTEVDPVTRVVREINGLPAVEEYARLIGVTPEMLTPDHFAAWPVVVMIDGTDYVRSIRNANPDGSLTFYCALEEGVVLRVAHGEDIVGKLEAALAEVQAELGDLEAVLACDCVLRNLEMSKTGRKDAAGDIFRRYKAVGFCTYGEQYDGVHVNQTLTGIAIGSGEVTHA
jgi:hypothetical protein